MKLTSGIYASILAFGDDLALVSVSTNSTTCWRFNFLRRGRAEYLEKRPFRNAVAAHLSPRFGEYFAEVLTQRALVATRIESQYEAAKQNLNPMRC